MNANTDQSLDAPTEIRRGQHLYFIIEAPSISDTIDECKRRGVKFLNATRRRHHVGFTKLEKKLPIYYGIVTSPPQERALVQNCKLDDASTFVWVVKAVA